MIVDVDQSVGTLIGFHNKLAFKSKNDGSRMALILQSTLNYDKHGNHVKVQVSKRTGSSVLAIGLDQMLCRVQDNGDLGCKLYLAYLHALTSHCLPDPLTLQTGTEQALSISRTKAVESFEQLSQNNIALLSLIAGLRPHRCFYPSHKRTMQQVDRDSRLSFLSYHGDFPAVVKHLYHISNFYGIFSSDTVVLEHKAKESHELLQGRDSVRSSTFRTFGFGAEHHTTSEDVSYAPRDRGIQSKRAINVGHVSKLVLGDDHARESGVEPPNNLWSLVQGAASVFGPAHTVISSSICFDANILTDGVQNIITKLLPVRQWLARERSDSNRRFAVSMWLGTMAFTKKADLALTHTLAMTFKSPMLANIEAPRIDQFSTVHGFVCSRQRVSDIVRTYQRRFERCAEYLWARQPNERQKAYQKRRRDAWSSSSSAAITQFVNAISNQ